MALRHVVLGALQTAKLMRLDARRFRSAAQSIQKVLKQDPDREPQDPETMRALIVEWAQAAGLKFERHERPVI